MKKFKHVILALLFICCTAVTYANTSVPVEVIKVKPSANKKIIYQYYSEDYHITIDYNPATGRVSSVDYDSVNYGEIDAFDKTGAGISHEQGSDTIYLDNYQVYIHGFGWAGLNGGFSRQ
jgi:hypothetical protein